MNGAYLQFAWPGPLDPGSPKSHQKPRLGAPNLETCTFWGVQTWKPAGPKPGKLHLLGGPNLEASTFWGGRNLRQVSRFWTPKRAGAQVSRFGPAKTCRFPPQTCRFAGLQVGPPPNVQVSRFGPPKTCRFPDLDPPKTCRFPGLDPQNVQVSRFKRACRFPGLAPKRAGFQVWTPQNDVWGVQTWKPARFGRNLHVLGGPNLETCTFPGSKPGNLHVWGVQTWKPALKEKFWGVETYQKGPEHEGFGVFRAFGFSGTEPNRKRTEPLGTGTAERTEPLRTAGPRTETNRTEPELYWLLLRPPRQVPLDHNQATTCLRPTSRPCCKQFC